MNDPPTDRSAQSVSKFRRYLPQVLATMAKNLLVLDIGMSLSFVTIVLPALRGLNPDKYPNERIQFTDEESTWFGNGRNCATDLGACMPEIQSALNPTTTIFPR